MNAATTASPESSQQVIVQNVRVTMRAYKTTIVARFYYFQDRHYEIAGNIITSSNTSKVVGRHRANLFKGETLDPRVIQNLHRVAFENETRSTVYAIPNPFFPA